MRSNGGRRMEGGGVFLDELGGGEMEAVGLFDGEFLGEEEGGGGIDAGAPRALHHVEEGHVGEGGGFAALSFPEEAEEAEAGAREGSEGFGLVGAGGGGKAKG